MRVLMCGIVTDLLQLCTRLQRLPTFWSFKPDVLQNEFWIFKGAVIQLLLLKLIILYLLEITVSLQRNG